MQRQDVLNVREDDTIAANLILEQSVLAGLLARDRNPYDTIARLAAMRIADSLSLSLSCVAWVPGEVASTARPRTRGC